MSALPRKPQPDALPIHSAAAPPSLWLYFALIAISFGMIAYAFSQQEKPDWPGLFLNLAAGLIGAVVVLVVVDRRLRSSEVEAIRSLPRTASYRASAWLFPTGRHSRAYCRSVLASLDTVLRDKLPRQATAALDAKVVGGITVLADPGAGKTTWLQMVARGLATKNLQGDPTGRVPIIFPLRLRHQIEPLEDEIYYLVSSFSRCQPKSVSRMLAFGKAVLLFDGYDELGSSRKRFETEVRALLMMYPKLRCSITSRSNCLPLSAELFGSSYQLPPPTDEEVQEILDRLARRGDA